MGHLKVRLLQQCYKLNFSPSTVNLSQGGSHKYIVAVVTLNQ